jgi:hypothetical protein
MTPEQIEIEGMRLTMPRNAQIFPDEETRDYLLVLNGETVGYARTMPEAIAELQSLMNALDAAQSWNGGAFGTPEALELRGAECGDCEAVARHYVNSRAVCCRHYTQHMNAPCACTASVGFTSDDFKARMAGLLDSLLGGPIMGGGILDELRNVRSELAKEGY